jgi:hypothetical protein
MADSYYIALETTANFFFRISSLKKFFSLWLRIKNSRKFINSKYRSVILSKNIAYKHRLILSWRLLTLDKIKCLEMENLADSFYYSCIATRTLNNWRNTVNFFRKEKQNEVFLISFFLNFEVYCIKALCKINL